MKTEKALTPREAFAKIEEMQMEYAFAFAPSQNTIQKKWTYQILE